MRFIKKLLETLGDIQPANTTGASGAPTTGDKEAVYLGRSARNNKPITFTGEGALLTIGPPGSGKSRGVAAWNLRGYGGSMLVTDPKGQLVKWSAEFRRERLRQDIAVLDPFGITDAGFPSLSLNPLAGLIHAMQAGAGVRAEAQRLAKMLLPDVPEAKDPYWRTGGRNLIIAGLLYLAASEREDCTLPELHRVLWLGDDEFLDTVIAPMKSLDAAGGALKQYADNIEQVAIKQAKAFSIFREEARAALEIFAAGEPCGEACRASNVDFSRLMTGGLTVYLVLPPEYVASHGRWMGLVTSAAVHAVMKSRQSGEAVFLLDEFPNLGRLPGIKDAIAQLREKGLRVWIMVQDLAQLEDVYGKPEALAMRQQAEVLQVLGCRSAELAEFIEKRAGTVTEQVSSFSMPDPLKYEAPKKNIQEQAVPVLSAAEALNMAKGKQILIRHGFPVIVANVEMWAGDQSG